MREQPTERVSGQLQELEFKKQEVFRHVGNRLVRFREDLSEKFQRRLPVMKRLSEVPSRVKKQMRCLKPVQGCTLKRMVYQLSAKLLP